MSKITPLFDRDEPKPETDYFEDFYKWYPHNGARKSKAKARNLFNKITQPGGCDTRSKNTDSGGFDDLHLEATPQEIIDGVKEYRKGLPKKSANSYEVDVTYVPNAYVWLNQGRWED